MKKIISIIMSLTIIIGSLSISMKSNEVNVFATTIEYNTKDCNSKKDNTNMLLERKSNNNNNKSNKKSAISNNNNNKSNNSNDIKNRVKKIKNRIKKYIKKLLGHEDNNNEDENNNNSNENNNENSNEDNDNNEDAIIDNGNEDNNNEDNNSNEEIVKDVDYEFSSSKTLFNNVGNNYNIWNSDLLQYDKEINKYVCLIVSVNSEVSKATTYRTLIDPITLKASEPEKITFSNGSSSWVQPASFKILNDGTYWMCYNNNIYNSTDNGKTWVYQYKSTGGFDCPWETTELSNGWILASRDVEYVKFRLSKDRGKTWTTVAPPNYDSTEGNFKAETTFLDLGNGNVMCITRQYETNAGWNEYTGTKPHKALISYSTDYGQTWSNYKLSSTIEMSDSSGGGFVKDGNVYLFTTNRWYPAYGLGKAGAVKYYKATIEDAKNDKFTDMGVLAYSNCSLEDGGHACSRFNCLSNAMDSDGNILLSYYDRPLENNTESGKITNYYFIHGKIKK